MILWLENYRFILKSISFQPVVPDVDYCVFWAIEMCFFSCFDKYPVHQFFCVAPLWPLKWVHISVVGERGGGVELLCIVAADQWEARRHGLDLHSHSHRLIVKVTVKVCSLRHNFRHNLHICRHRQLLADTNSVIMKLWSIMGEQSIFFSNWYIAHHKNIPDSLKLSK